jgi:hypothetical protein
VPPNITVEPLFKNYKKAIHFNSAIVDPEVVFIFERNNAGLKKLSQQSSDSFADPD